MVTELSRGQQFFRDTYDLNPSELRVLPDICMGKTSKEIMAQHNIKRGTVNHLVSGIMKKTGTRNRTEIMHLWMKSLL